MRYRQNTKGDILYGPPVIRRFFPIKLICIVSYESYHKRESLDETESSFSNSWGSYLVPFNSVALHVTKNSSKK